MIEDSKDQELILPAKNSPRKKMIITVPHAFDVPSFFGGTILKYAKNDWQISAIVCSSSNRDTEKHELSGSGKILGLKNVYFLKNKTGNLKQVGIDNLKMDIFEILEEEKAETVLSFAKHGFSQNPEYRLISLATELAFERRLKILIPDEHDTVDFHLKLFFLCLPEQFLKFVQSKGFLQKDLDGFNFEGLADKKITHVIEIKNFVSQKIEALKKHQSAERITSRLIQLLREYKSSHMEYYSQIQDNHEKIYFEEIEKISSRF